MLTSQALEEALPLSLVLDAKDIVLTPIAQTPLAELVRETVILDDESKAGETPIDIEATSVATEAFELNVDGSGHDLAMDEIVKTAADNIRSQISFTKNVVRPKLIDYIKAIEEDIVNLPLSGLAKYAIVQYEPIAPINDPSFSDSLDLFENTPYEPYDFKLRLPEVSDETLSEFISTPSEGLNQAIAAWTAKVGIGFVREVYNTVFRMVPSKLEDSGNYLELRSLFADKEQGPDWALAVYLLANHLAYAPPEETNNTLEEYKAALFLLRNQSGKRLYILKGELGRSEDSARLVKEFQGNTTVVVYNRVYERFIEDGGDNDVLLGDILSATPYYSVEEINNHAEELKALWMQNKALEERIAINNKFSYVKESLRSRFREILSEEDMTASDQSTSLKIFDEELSLIKVDELVDICDVCLKLLTRSLYFTSDAERILSSMEKTSVENPTMQPREAALISAIELATDWVCSQMSAESTY